MQRTMTRRHKPFTWKDAAWRFYYRTLAWSVIGMSLLAAANQGWIS